MEAPFSPSDQKETRAPAIRQGWLRTFLFLVSAFILSLAGQLIGMLLVVSLTGTELDKSFSPDNIIETLGVWPMALVMLFGFAGMLAALIVFRRFVDRRNIISLGFRIRNRSRDMIAGFGWGVILIGGGFLILWISGFIAIEAIRFDINSITGYIIFFIIVSLNEEIMFRGYIITNLRDSMNRNAALITSSVIFAVAHLSNANISLISAINIFLAGVLLGIYYIYRGNLWFPVMLHFSWNYFQGPVFGFEVSGSSTYSIIVQNISGHPLITGEPFGFEGSLPATILMITGISALYYFYHDDEEKHAPENDS